MKNNKFPLITVYDSSESDNSYLLPIEVKTPNKTKYDLKKACYKPWIYTRELIEKTFGIEVPNKISISRKTMSKAFNKDPDFRNTYVANIACKLHDSGEKKISWRLANKLAEEVLDLVFDS